MVQKREKDVNRRRFLKKSAQGAATLATLGTAPAVFAAPKFSPNDTIGVGHIGCGVRGGELVVDVAGVPAKEKPGVKGGEVRAICEIYKPHLEKGLRLSANPKAKSYHNYEDMLADKDIDAIVIAVPDHWHSRILIDAANAGKDIYVEKCWTRTIPEAREMLKAIKRNKTVMQLGHHQRASTAAIQAAELIQQGILGEVTFVRTGCFRNRPRGKDEWRWYGGYNQYIRPDEKQVVKDLDWPRFLGNATYHPFSMERFWHWRCYWDYGTGIAGDLLSHAFDFANYILKLGIPYSCSCSGHNNLLKDGREAPDTWNTIFEYPDRGTTLIYSSTFNSQLFSPNTDEAEIRGKDAMMKTGMNDFEIYAEESSSKYKDDLESGKIKFGEPFRKFDPKATPEAPSHMQDFINCMRTRKQPKCNEDEAFAEAVTCIMSVISYFEGRTVCWDSARQEVV